MKRLFVFLFALTLGAQVLSQTFWPSLSAVGTTTIYAIPGNPSHTLAAVVTGAPSGCTLNLDGSLDAVNWFDLSGPQTCTSSVMFSVVNRPVAFVRGHVTVLTGGTAPAVAMRYLGTR